MSSSQINTIFFDVGDTLLSDYPDLPERISLAFNSLGMRVSGDRLNQGLRRAEDYILPLYVLGENTEDPAVRRRGLEILCETAGFKSLDDDHWTEFYQAFNRITFDRVVHPEATDLLVALKKSGKALGIISDWDPSLHDLLDGLGIGRYFDTFSVSAIVGAEKPAAPLFRDALRQSGANAEDCLHVGDFYELDYLGARGVGMRALLYDWRGRSSLPSANRVESFRELAATILSMAGAD